MREINRDRERWREMERDERTRERVYGVRESKQRKQSEKGEQEIRERETGERGRHAGVARGRGGEGRPNRGGRDQVRPSKIKRETDGGRERNQNLTDEGQRWRGECGCCHAAAQ